MYAIDVSEPIVWFIVHCLGHPPYVRPLHNNLVLNICPLLSHVH